MSQVVFGKRGAVAGAPGAAARPAARAGADKPGAAVAVPSLDSKAAAALYARLAAGDDGEAGAAAPDRIDPRDVELCVGPGWSDFEAVNDRFDAGAAVAPSFCWGALMGGPVWLARRKQWVPLAALAAGTLALELGLGKDAGWWIGLANLPLAFLSRDLVVRRARAIVAQARGSGLDPESARAAIQRQGGLSRLGGFVFAAIAFAAAIATTLDGLSGLAG
ncbi:MAG: hypothetical protein KGI57_02385 [Hyphomicrobiales bacterium]|nr:hypothetical protein [Hyphomicrobiales bacterium]MDE2016533.1 hypothetical protein [Hyphomicrobiales bacterium]